MNPRAITALLGDEFKLDEIPGCTAVTHDEVVYLTGFDEGYAAPFTPPGLDNHGNYIVSLSQLTRWLGEKVKALGNVDVFEGMPAALPLFQGEGKSAKVMGVQCRDQGIDKHKQRK